MALFLRPLPPPCREDAIRAYKSYRIAKEQEIRAANTRSWPTAWYNLQAKAKAADAVKDALGLTWQEILYPEVAAKRKQNLAPEAPPPYKGGEGAAPLPTGTQCHNEG